MSGGWENVVFCPNPFIFLGVGYVWWLGECCVLSK